VGSERHKTRPAVIVCNNDANRNFLSVVVIPLSSNSSRVYPGEALVTVDGKPGKAMADQIMAADKSRLKTHTGTLSKADMVVLEQAILVHLGLL
jgi:mRNA interferase MazF